MIASALGAIGTMHLGFVKSNTKVKLFNGTTFSYPASESSMALLEADDKTIKFHLLLKDFSFKGIKKLTRLEGYESVICFSIQRDLERTCMRLHSVFEFEKAEYKRIMDYGNIIVDAIRESISNERGVTVPDAGFVKAINGNFVHAEQGTELHMTTCYANTICSGCARSFPLGVKPKHCTRCNLSVLYCNKECQLKHWPQHKTVCKPGAMAIFAPIVSYFLFNLN